MPAEPLVLRSRVPGSAAGARLVDYLAARFRYHDDAGWRREVDAGRVRVDDAPASAEQRLVAGSQIAYERVHAEPFVDDRIAVLHEDEAILVIDKPAHLPMHADGPFVRSTLVQILRTRRHEPGLMLVHRLDRETSGVCVLPRTAAARASLHAQFAARSVDKTYSAVVHGVVAADIHCTAPIGRAGASAVAIRRAAGAMASAAEPAETSFAVVARGPAATLLRCEPRTGRTHQIRAHLEHLGHPIIGDKLYGRSDAQYLEFVRAVKRTGDVRTAVDSPPDRHLLHAAELAFTHPATGRLVRYVAAMPAMFLDHLHASG